ncbi:ABC transporter ATP-binding protein [Allopusillimonas ginsengisoli]|uniref:ABC transporter ATP-binding protein n=1 Tax=Allopusillimonas ginsengisoli TaxID=453575 RepID=UPI0010212A52|nr:oligopeptide/dipeptide ABC transporter ATP-binding protein [Allopusillimonas ginsengisoli]TEA80061.1 ATP-binding cassette domain-containing protein [Allopusillimonas ginsengisoli]
MNTVETSQPLLSVRDLKVHFQIGRARLGKEKDKVHAVDGVSFDIQRGRTMAIVGESGSGKTTTALSIMRLAPVTAGSIIFNDVDLTKLEGEALRAQRRHIQLVFQDPYSSLNPRQRAGEIVRMPLMLMGIGTPAEQREKVSELFRLVGLRDDQQVLFPHQFSGGQRQRLNIARALATDPQLVVCDEPVSALDIAIRAQILNLLRRIQIARGQSFLFISHDMAVVEHICDDIAVMYLGQIVEQASRVAFFSRPLHPYSVALMSAVPTVSGGREKAANRIKLAGDPPSPINPPSGCRFAGRCPAAQALCQQEPPSLREVLPGHKVACHFVRVEDGRVSAPLDGHKAFGKVEQMA